MFIYDDHTERILTANVTIGRGLLLRRVQAPPPHRKDPNGIWVTQGQCINWLTIKTVFEYLLLKN